MDTNYSYFNTAKGYRVVGGTAAQFLKADGSVDSNAYLPLSGGIMTGTINFDGGEIIFQRSGVNRITTNSTSTYISGDNGLVVVRPGGNLVTTGQVLFNKNNTSQYTDSHNILLGTQTSFGGSIFHTAVASAVSGYGVWLNYNLQWDGTNFIQPRGSVGSYGFTVNNHKGFSFNYAASGGTNGSATTLTEVASLNGLGTFSTTTVDVKTLQLPYAAKSIIRFGGANNERVHHKVFNDSIVTPPTGILSFSIIPPSASATMFDITIKIHAYGGAVAAEIRLTFYRQVATAINATAGMSGSIWASEGFNTEIVNVGFDPAGKMVINIGDSTIAWGTYLSYEIERMETKYTGGGQDWANGWSASIITDTTDWSLVKIPLQRVATRGWVTPQLTAMDAKYPLRGLFGGNTNSVRSLDTRNVNPLPSTNLQSGVWFDFKTSSVIGLTGAGVYSGVITMVPFSDNSGNINTAFRLAQSAGKMFFQNYTAAATWGPLNEFVHTGNMASILANYWTKATSGSYVGISASTPFAVLNASQAQNIYAGGLLISNVYSDSSNLPANGIYSKGTISTESHGDSSQWFAAFGYGNHANAGYATNAQLLNYYTKNESFGLFVGLNVVQTINSTKTFSSSPIVPNATLNSHAVNLGQVNANFAARDGANATSVWRNGAYGLINNPTIPDRTKNSAGDSDLINATYGDVMGMINSSGTNLGNPSGDWYHRIKMLHNNSAGYYTEIAVQMTGGSSLWFRKYEDGVFQGPNNGWKKVATTEELEDFIKTPSGASVIISGQDLNDVKKSGFYRGIDLINAPSNGWWFVSVEGHDDAWCKQTVTSYGSNNAINVTYQRVLKNWVWTAWKEITTGGGIIVDPVNGHMGYGGVDPTASHNHYFNGTIRVNQGIYSESSNGNDVIYAGNGGFYHLDEEIRQEDKVIRLTPFDRVFSGTNNTFATRNRVVKITLTDGGMIIMDEFFVNQVITIMNISGDYATFIVNNTPIKVKINPKSSATFYVNSENRMVMVRMDHDYCSILG